MSDVTLWIDPPSYHFEGDRLFDVAGAPTSGDSILAPYVHLKTVLAEQGVDVHTADLLDDRSADGRLNLYASTGMTKRLGALAARDDVTLSAFLVLECPLVARSMFAGLPEASRLVRRMFAFNDGRALAPFLREPVRFEPIRYPYAFEGVDERVWSRGDRSLMTMINANKALPRDGRELYTERLKAVEYFARFGEIDLYGVGWDGPPFRVGGAAWVPGTVRRLGRLADRAIAAVHPDPLLVAARRVWRGQVPSKADVLGRYRFSICFENQLLEGWITEKMFDCLRAGCIPVYLGAPDVREWVPAECFIDMRQFSDYDELRAFMRSLGEREVQGYREAGRSFLQSERFRPFSKQAFTEVFSRIVTDDAAVPAR